MPLLKVNDGTPYRTPQTDSAKLFFTIAAIEVALIVICFAMLAGQPAPNVNESHYLTKAKHFWNPSYCPGDLFLSSSFSHLSFYVLTGWITKFTSLSTYAWIGRLVTWALIAVGWRRVCRCLFDVPLLPVLTAVFFCIVNQRFHLAGEWVIGGFEAKGFAYGFVLLAISHLLQQRWNWVWPLLGIASMFHVLVGGWSTIAVVACWLSSVGASPLDRNIVAIWKELRRQWIPLLIGFGIAMIGILPPLLAGGDSDLQRRANAIYVAQRISHHLNFASFPVAHISRFVLLVMAWSICSRWLRLSQNLDRETKSRIKTLEIFTATTLVFSLAGLVLSGMAEQGGEQSDFANQFLRFYLFRLSDFAVPASMALICGKTISLWVASTSDFPRRVCAAIFIGCTAVAGIAMAQQNNADGRPNADARSLPHFPDAPQRTYDVFKNWKRVCDWVSQNTPHDAVFITPAQQQTFKWYAGRTEVCNWKDVPQDPAAMVQWKQRVDQLIIPQRSSDLGIFVYSDQQLRHFAQIYGATHLIAKQSESNSLAIPSRLKQVYPENKNHKTTWVVFSFDDH